MSRYVCSVAMACILCSACPRTASSQPLNQIQERCEAYTTSDRASLKQFGVNLSKAGVEPWCEAGESVVGLALEVGPSRSVHRDNPRCGNDYDTRNVDYAVEGLRAASAYAASTGTPRGLIPSMAAREIGIAVQKAAPGTLGRLLSGVVGDEATCRTIAVAIPSGQHITRVQTSLATPSRAPHASGRCGLFRVESTTTALPDHRCVADDLVFGDPSTAFFGFEKYRIDTHSGIVAVTAKNWSEHLTRVAYLRVYYK